MVIQRKFIIIGTDDNRTPFFPPEVLEHIRHGKVFSGGVRHKEIVGNLLPDDAEWISITVPSIVIMVPGLYLYRAIYNLGIMSLNVSASWFAAAILIIVALPLGLIFARILTDKMFRYCT